MARGKIPKLGRVTSRELGSDGEAWYVTVEWIDEEGYRVAGDFKLIGWRAAPRKVAEEVQAILSKPPRVLYRRG
jgi:hypothetical protein